MRVLRRIEILAWTVGVSLLVTYASTRAWYAQSRDRDVATFEAAAVLARSADPVDMTAWSRVRVDRYRESFQASRSRKRCCEFPR